MVYFKIKYFKFLKSKIKFKINLILLLSDTKILINIFIDGELWISRKVVFILRIYLVFLSLTARTT